MPEQPKHTNRLINEKSPYLLQHSHNPVDWYPWGEEAFQAARNQDRPILLSIGYATCHWCHVMEEESFEDEDVARRLNEAFINIKVDREELPEVDGLYMEFAQSMMSGAAGWPLNVILTPELKPFFAVTYLPPRASEGMMGLTDLIDRILEVWDSPERHRVIAQADKIVEVFSASVHTKGLKLPSEGVVDTAMELLYKMADPVYGGLKGAPKFPIAYQINLLMEYSFKHNDSRALFIAEKTLDMMQRGGIYDHLGGGFSRYSVDERWLVPHFEKMLYDNALLCDAYTQAWKITGNDLYEQVSKDIVRYVFHEMTSPEGAFYSAQDADTDGVEGLYYTWTVEEVNEVLDSEEAALACKFFEITGEGNFEGRNVLHTSKRVDEYAAEIGESPDDLTSRLSRIKSLLLEARQKRTPPFKDDKVLSGWNGLMIHALAESGAAFNDPSYIASAERAADFLKERLWADGILLRRWRQGDARFSAGLDDYAFVIKGLITLYEAGGGVHWLKWAMELAEILSRNFKSEGGCFYQTESDDPNLILRNCQYSDGAEPSGNAVHCENLIRLYQLTYEPRYFHEAGDILMAVKKHLDTYSPGYGYHLLSLMRYYDQSAPSIVVALNENEDLKGEIYKRVFSNFIPHRAVVWRKSGDEDLFQMVPFLKGQVPLEGKTTVYICHDRVCEKPLNDADAIFKAIEQL